MWKKLFYGFYFFIWGIFLVLGTAFFTEKFYVIGLLGGRVMGLLAISALVFTQATLGWRYIVQRNARQEIKQMMLICLSPMMVVLMMVLYYFIPAGLEKEKHTFELIDMQWACDCAEWIPEKEYDAYYDVNMEALEKACFYLEPASPVNEFPEDFDRYTYRLKVTGNFYKKKGFPKGYFSHENPEKAKVFRYTSFSLVKK